MVAAAAPLASKPQQLHQTWWKNGSCPAGTVPIRRDSSRANPEIAELVRRSSPFGRPGSSRAGSYNQSAMAAPPGGKVEVAAAFATNAPYLGARARLPYWKVNVHPAGEFSMSYILIGNTLDTDYVAIKGADPPPHLTNQIAVGLVDPAGNRWWVSVMDQEIGYYPESVFNTRFPDAAYVEMGGRVLDSRPGGKHTTTPMGSGMPACAGWGFAATIIQYLGVSSDGVLFNDDASKTIATTLLRSQYSGLGQVEGWFRHCVWRARWNPL
ncbi:uncharacterized protein LOC120670450 [Panicum virgatum]|uniref:uncharacterized protein LOC120670449 n=1 Tax=Panicum virgatum TaxID=38727 RepID=UPI0019D5151D|nr:uncharacterized protein LOC120670449 [Panicum virgatum]XP_039806482.1 uncharacterized protein LOC120670450 [Panicum virgatum]